MPGSFTTTRLERAVPDRACLAAAGSGTLMGKGIPVHRGLG